MSAIAGFWGGHADGPDRACRRMLDAMWPVMDQPDRIDIATGIALGARGQLADRSGADTSVEASGHLLAADIRLDNRTELAAALAVRAGHDDRTLLGLALQRWGLAALPRVIGDWAFAWYSPDDRRLILARDPLGGRPLVWHRTRDVLAFASMPGGLHALDGIERRPDAIRSVRLVGGLPSRDNRSFFENIQRVQPGHVAIFDAGGRVRHQRFWNPSPTRLRLAKPGDYVEAYRAVLDTAVGARVADAPAVAAHLSGGWDSAAVTATAAQQGARVVAFTSVPTSPDASAPGNRFADEGSRAAAVARLYPAIDHVMLPLSPRSPIAQLDRDLALYDRPMVNLCNHVWLEQIREAARARDLHVMLTGEIGNFTISNAPASILADFIARGAWIAWAREAALAVRLGRSRVRGVLANSFAPWLPTKVWQRFESLGSGTPFQDQFALNPDMRATLADEIAASEAEWRPKHFFDSTLQSIRDLDFGEYHQGVRRGWQIDKRDPTADVRVVEFMLSLPPHMFLHRGQRRPLAHAALSDRLPPEILDEPNKGYQASDWHRGLTADLPAVRALIDRIAADPTAAGVIDVALLRNLVKHWPTEGWERPAIIGRYRNALLTALSVGHFLAAA